MPKQKKRKKVLVGWISDEFDWTLFDKGIFPSIILKEYSVDFKTKIRITLEAL